MIDLRSDTLTIPDVDMLETILSAELGDDGRQDENGRGEDRTTNRLEDLAARLVGKDSGLYFSSGTLANTCSLLTWCTPGQKVIIDRIQHIYKTEKIAFSERFGQLHPVFVDYTADDLPDLKHMETLLKTGEISLVCMENTHNFRGGKCIPLGIMSDVYDLARSYGVRVHLDGARIFNAAAAMNVSADEICKYADSVMFCVSKGLGAPIGSLLCGSGEFILNVRKTRKLLGGNMRQCGVIAAPAIYALENNRFQLKRDNENAATMAKGLSGLKVGKLCAFPESNIVLLDITPYGMSAKEYCAALKELGVNPSTVGDDRVRFVFHKEISNDDAVRAAQLVMSFDEKAAGA